tara:strand:- start:1693 stop:2241 length:549 start_codon:yes stop_codon:yes gene_type:complete
MIPVKVLKISYHPSSRSYTVILKEITGDMCLPVIVGTFEAQSIALAMEMVHTPRPLTHDLICDVITNINGNLNAIKINQLDDGIFYAQLELEYEKIGLKTLDSRPSDAIAIALRMNAPILISTEIMHEAGISENELKEKESSRGNKKTISLSDLKEGLKKAIDDEEYEMAAKLRDKISLLES